MKLFKRQQYERPTGRYQCGRAACWDKPCFNGPKPDGSCGGVTECAPIRKGDHWECCRPAAAGGPCAAGPKPDGSCCLTRPPCVPRLTMRARRGRITLLACLVVVASLMAWFHFGSPHGPMAAVNPGPLSGAHQHLTGIIFAKTGKSSGGDIHNCSLCHRAHDAGAAGWIAAAFQSSQMSRKCLACHRFGDPSNTKIQNREHNEVFAHATKKPETECQMCHTEHHGVKASLISISDAQCNTCHAKSVHNFAKDHPAFAENYPLRQFAAIRFDHNKHAGNYFAGAEFKCTTCHVASSTERGIITASFAQTCARCHLKDIPANNLPVLHLDPSNPTGSPFNKVLFADGKDANNFFREVSASGNALQTRLQTASGTPDLKPLFRGVNWDAVKSAAALMLKNANNAASIPASAGDGWLVTSDTDDGLPELRYHATSHADPVMMAWLEFSVKSTSEFQTALLSSKTGPGSCAKCHVAVSGKPGAIVWQPQIPPVGHTVFSHGTHLKLLECTGCHAPNAAADLSKQFAANVNIFQTGAKPVSSFTGIKLTTCSQCHAEKRIAQDCRLCHRYHLEPTLQRPGLAPVIPAHSVLASVNTEPAQPDAAAIAAQKAAAQKTVADKAAADKATADKAAADKLAADQAAAEKTAADKAAADKAAADKLAGDKAKSNKDKDKAKAAADKAAAAKLAADKAAAEKAAVDKAAANKAAAAAAAATQKPPPVTAPPATTPAATAAARPARFHGEFIGNQDCVGCHDAEKGVWEASRHNKSWDLRRGGAKVVAILAAVGDKKRATDEPTCANCHFTVVANTPKFGVSCESCHGAASEWKDIHNTGKDSPAKHTAAMEAARQKGMIHSSMKQDLIQNCFGCHNYDSGKVSGDVIAKMIGAGHPAFDFEFVAFSQGSVRHRFYPPTPDNNAEMKPDELARWYVIGQAGQLVSSTRVLAGPGADAVKSAQQDKIAKATKVLGMIDLPEAKALLGAPTDENLEKLISAANGKDFTGKVGSMVPTSFK